MRMALWTFFSEIYTILYKLWMALQSAFLFINFLCTHYSYNGIINLFLLYKFSFFMCSFSTLRIFIIKFCISIVEHEKVREQFSEFIFVVSLIINIIARKHYCSIYIFIASFSLVNCPSFTTMGTQLNFLTSLLAFSFLQKCI